MMYVQSFTLEGCFPINLLSIKFLCAYCALDFKVGLQAWFVTSLSEVADILYEKDKLLKWCIYHINRFRRF